MACSLCELVAAAFVAMILYSVSTTIQYYVKFIFFAAVTTISATLCIPFMLHRPRDYRNALVPAWFTVQAVKLIGTEYEVKGIENIKRENGGVVLINHQSAIDMAVLGTLWPLVGRPTQVSKKEVLYSPFGLAAYLWGTIYIDRKNRSESLNVINQQSKAINERKSKILFFPEGTRSQSETLLPFKKGPFHVAIQSQCPILPIVVSRYTHLDSKRKYFGRGKSIIKILPEISTKGLDKSNVDTLLSDVQKLMQENYEKLNDEVAALNHMKYY